MITEKVPSTAEVLGIAPQFLVADSCYPQTLEVLSVNSAAHELHQRLPYEREIPLIGQRLTALTPPELHPLVYKHIETVRANGSDQALDLELRGHYFDVNSALITAGNRQFLQMILHDVSQRHEMLDTLLKAERLAAAGTFASAPDVTVLATAIGVRLLWTLAAALWARWRI